MIFKECGKGSNNLYGQISIDSLCLNNPDKSLIIIGNGFDIVHGAKSSYYEFQKTIGKNSPLRYDMETYLDVPKNSLWNNLEDSLGHLDYSLFLNSDVLDMYLKEFGAYDPDAQAADFFAAVETAIGPTFNIPRELKSRFKKWLKTLKVESDIRPYTFLKGNFRVLSFNYTEFIEELYDVNPANICYIHGCRKYRGKGKPDEIILGHIPQLENEQWDKVEIKPKKFRNKYKRYILDAAIETALNEAVWYDDETTKNCDEIIKNHQDFFDGLGDIEEIIVIGHSLSKVDYPYFKEITKKCDAKWTIGYHSLNDFKRLITFVDYLGIKNVTIFRT